ncbi:DnaA ATPase domain-containing protein [Streptomyces nymphaeiformis]|uniref:Chromosomal replication initiation ATPase DnaA n=1 Tax=Streptomyces nymphaeiformis TaxID=2663842 RepID=A0A7W7U6A6_9ACTN|nr:DnaA/Hda family protein [Streptomyces nymphaeiformis]MBB4984972.1 chromosomal replication initiation ATPase DnaA [Streptomyces nymphaeiformis]
MPSISDDDDRDSVRTERREAAVSAFLQATPVIYRRDVAIHPRAAEWATQADTAPVCLFLTGAIGIGKTHTAWQATRQWLGTHITRTGRKPRIETWRSTALFDALRPDNHDWDVRTLTRQLQEADLLYIDDLAAARVSPTGWTQERLYEIFDERYINRRPCLITCDVLPGATANIVGDRVQSRLREMFRGGVLLLEGADRRAGDAA